jgi:hypothetical protein
MAARTLKRILEQIAGGRGAEISKSVITTERNEMKVSSVVVANKSLRHRKKEYSDPDVKIQAATKGDH